MDTPMTIMTMIMGTPRAAREDVIAGEEEEFSPTLRYFFMLLSMDRINN